MSGIREQISRVALAAALVAGATLMSAPEAFAKKDSELPTLSPSDELTDTKLTPAVAKILADAITDLNARNFNDAGAQIRQARVVPGLTTYDTFQIDNLTILLAEGTKDAVLGFAAVEEMVQSSALTDKDHHAVYANGLLFAAAKKDYWRAIQYGEIERRENILAPKDVRLLAGLYALIGSYADAERIAQWGLDTENPEGKEREKLQKAVGVMQIKEGKTVATPGAGSALLGALLQGVGQGLAQGLGDQSAEPPPAPPSAEDQQAQAQSDAQDAFAKAQKQAATEVYDATPDVERTMYADLAVQEDHLSPADRKRAHAQFEKAFGAWKKQDCTTATPLFKAGLDIDPASAPGNYYYADCLVRDGDLSLQVVDYLARAVAFSRTGDSNATSARQALQQLAGN